MKMYSAYDHNQIRSHENEGATFTIRCNVEKYVMKSNNMI